MRTAVNHVTIAAAVIVASVLVSTTASADDRTVSYTTHFTVDNPADIGDATPGDGLCSIDPDKDRAKMSTTPATPPTSRVPAPLPATSSIATSGSFQTIPSPYPPITPPPTPEGGSCTLRAAVEESNANPDVGHMLTIPSSLGIYRLTEGQLRVEGAVHISRDFSPGSKRSAINAGHRSRVFDVAPGARLQLDGVFVAQGKVGEGGSGGAIRVGRDASVTVRRSVIVHSQAGRGGGVFVDRDGFFLAHWTSIESNSARIGGGVYAEGVTEFEQSSVYDNTAATGAGIYMQTATFHGHLRGENLSVLQNVASGSGGGLYLTGSGWSRLLDTTVAGNSAGQGGGIHVSGNELSLWNTVVADNRDTANPNGLDAGPDCAGPVKSEGALNLIGAVGPVCTGYDPGRDLLGTVASPLDPELEPVRISSDATGYGDGGELAYRRPAAGSPLVDAIAADRCSQTHDMIRQNVRVRVLCDLGAIER